MYDVIIIGAGVIGSSIARELSRYAMKIGVIEKEIDVAMGTTKSNSAIVHAGFDAKPGSNKGKLNVLGNSLFDQLAEELDFPFKRIGSLVLCFDRQELELLHRLKAQGEANGVTGLEILEGNKVRALEPNISDKVVAALHAPTGAIVSPYEMTIAMAENAWANGTAFFFENKVLDIINKGDSYSVITDKGSYEGRMVINAAGIYADDINDMVSDSAFRIVPRKGEYCLFDKAVGSYISRTVFQLPTRMGKGILVTPTVDGNLLIGPNAADIEDKSDLTTTRKGLDEILEKAGKSINCVPHSATITSFSGLRAHSDKEDFIIEEAADAKGFINVAGVESPGLSSAPAIAIKVKDMVIDVLRLEINPHFKPHRKSAPKFRELSNTERAQLIKENPSYGKIICRCETVTEGEILDAIRRPLGAKTLDGIKQRTRAGAGRCQSGFCMTRILDILSKELGVAPTEITKFGGGSRILLGKNKEDI